MPQPAAKVLSVNTSVTDGIINDDDDRYNVNDRSTISLLRLTFLEPPRFIFRIAHLI